MTLLFLKKSGVGDFIIPDRPRFFHKIQGRRGITYFVGIQRLADSGTLPGLPILAIFNRKNGQNQADRPWFHPQEPGEDQSQAR